MARLSLDVTATDKGSVILDGILRRLNDIQRQGNSAAASVGQGTSKAVESLKKSADTAQAAAASYGAMGTASSTLLLRLGGLVGVLAGLTAFTKSAAHEAEGHAQAMNRLGASLTAAGISIANNRSGVESWAKSLQGLTRFADTELVDALGRTVRRINDLDQAQRLVVLSADLAVANGGSLSDALETLTLAAAGNARGLLMLRKQFGDLLAGVSSSEEAIAKLEEKFGGTARAEESLTKRSAQLRNEFDDLKKGVGVGLLPLFEKLIGVLGGSVRAFNNLGESEANTGRKAEDRIAMLREQIKLGGKLVSVDDGLTGSRKELVKFTDEEIRSRERAIKKLEEQANKEEQAAKKPRGRGRVRTEDEIKNFDEVIKKGEERAKAGEEIEAILASQIADRLAREGRSVDELEVISNAKLEKDLERIAQLGEAFGLSEEEKAALSLETAMRADEAFQDLSMRSSDGFKTTQAVAQASLGSIQQGVAAGVDKMIFDGARF